MVEIVGGEKLRARLAEVLKNTRRIELKVGFLAGPTYANGKSVPMIAVFNEFGVPSNNQPPRPFFRKVVRYRSREWPTILGNLLVANNYDGVRTMEMMGQGIKGQIQQSIVDLTRPPLAPYTIKKKGFDKPLIETSLMLNSVDYKVTRR